MLEDKIATISRAQGTLTFPANFMLVAAMNPCPCGYHADPVKECTCALAQVMRYQTLAPPAREGERISGPLLDRIDIHIDVPQVEYDKRAGDRLGESSAKIRERVERARELQRKRFAGTSLQCNGDVGPAEVRQFCIIDETGKSLLRSAMPKVPRPWRGSRCRRSSKIPRSPAGRGLCGADECAGFPRILKLARTIADLADCDRIDTPHLAEVIQFRPRRMV